MFIPIGDENPTERRPYVTYALLAINILVYIAMMMAPEDQNFIHWMMVPARLDWPTLFTSMFMHAGILHLAGNMLFLWIFGDNVEDRLGHIGYTVFYFACGLIASAAHILSDPSSELPTLGASGAISGVMGAYIVFFPRHHVKMLVWFLVVGVFRTPAYVWIGIWFLQQVFLNAQLPAGKGGVAYLAHIGGFVAGAVIAGSMRLIANHWPSSRRRADPLDARSPNRRLFHALPEDPGIDWMDQPGDGYSVLRLSENPGDVSRISEVVAPITAESPFDVVDRLVVTRGLIAREIPREAAGRIQRELQGHGIPSAIILHNQSNFPPRPVVVEGATWDGRGIRIRAGDQITMVPWSAPFLFVGARTEGNPLIDVFVNRRTAFRIPDARHIPLREIAPDGRTESDSGLGGFARAVLDRAQPAAINEGVRTAANRAEWARLDFRNPSDYDDYVFWLYNLTLAQGSRG